MRFKLRFPRPQIRHWATRYADAMDDIVPSTVGAAAKRRGYLDKADFLKVTRWKSPRTAPLCASNSPAFIKDVTALAFSTRNERLAIESLTLLDGVSWPTASVFLHFCSRRRYPILDYRALWSLSCTATPADYDFALWEEYVKCTRQLTSDAKVSMRELDRALWAYSKVRQR